MNFSSGKALKATLFFVFILLAAAGLLSSYVFHNVVYVATDDAYVDGRIYTIAAKISGTVKAVNAEDNQSVKKGDLLVEIEAADYEVKRAEAQANLDIQQATIKQAELDLARAQKLVQEGALAQEKLDRAQTAFALAQAQVKQREAALKAAQLNLEYTKIFSPADGRVTKKAVEVGNQILAHQPLLAVVSLEDIWIVANYKETQLKNIHPGQRVKIKVDTYPRKTFMGRVDSIMAGTGAAFSLFPPENALGSYVKVVQRVPVKIVFEDFPKERYVLRVGMSVAPKIIARDE